MWIKMKDLQGIKRLRIYLQKKKRKLIFILFTAVIVSVLELLPARIVGKIVDLMPIAERKSIICVVVIFGVVYFSTSVIKVIYGNMVMDYTNSIIEDVRKDLFSSSINKTVTMSDADISGDIITRVTSDVEQITRVVAGPLNGFLGKILNFLFALILLGLISIRLAFVTILVSGVLYFLSKDISKKNKENGAEERTRIGVISRKLTDVLRNIILVKSYGTEKQEIKELNKESNNVFYCRKKLLLYMTKYWSFVEFFNGVGYVFAFLITVNEIFKGHCSIGQIVVIYSYLQMIFSSMISVSRYKTDIYNANAAMERVFALIPSDYKKFERQQNYQQQSYSQRENSYQKFIDKKVEKIEVENLAISYGDKMVIDGVSFELEKGKLVALTGESGKGKSSIIHAMLGLTDISSGKIFFDGEDVTAKPEERKRQIRIAFQNPYLFQKSIEENLKYGGQRDNWCKIFENIGVAQIIEKAGVDKILDTTNKSLSGGEQRRLAIVRNVNKKVPCYIFDEPTSELDTSTKQQVIEALLILKQKAMVLVVTHDKELMQSADTRIIIK